ncbi:hypothetical protein M2S45_24930 [Klebsiella pneumoniae]|nr:hypothetical protein [Klebsiella pneumoniae]MDZ0510029.1 hypothetical protein [Klebsiella pneumoniae]
MNMMISYQELVRTFPNIMVYDLRKEKDIERKLDERASSDWCVAVRDADAEIDANIYFPSAVLSTAG